MGMIYGMLALLFALIIGLYILVLNYRSDISLLKNMFEVNNDYLREFEKHWTMAIDLCEKVCNLNEQLINRDGKEDQV